MCIPLQQTGGASQAAAAGGFVQRRPRSAASTCPAETGGALGPSALAKDGGGAHTKRRVFQGHYLDFNCDFRCLFSAP